MMKFETLLDAASSLYQRGYQWRDDYQRFQRGSWYAYIRLYKSGKCSVVSS